MLTRRLAALVEAGMLERRRYSERPPRHEYVLTERGRDFRTVLLALLAFGDRHFAVDGGGGAQIVDAATGATAEPMLVDRRTGRPLVEPDFTIVRGSAPRDAKADRCRSTAPRLATAAAPRHGATPRRGAPRRARAMSSLAAGLPVRHGRGRRRGPPHRPRR